MPLSRRGHNPIRPGGGKRSGRRAGSNGAPASPAAGPSTPMVTVGEREGTVEFKPVTCSSTGVGNSFLLHLRSSFGR